MGDGGLDAVAKDLAAGEISRRTALRRMAAVTVAATVPALLSSEVALARCPKSRRCGNKCCPRNARCKRGKCKCKSGYSKCGKKCFDLQTDENHCGTCTTVCDPGEICAGGACVDCVAAPDCPDQSQQCMTAACTAGVCTYQTAPGVGAACVNGSDSGVGACFNGQVVCNTACRQNGTNVANGTACDDGNLCTLGDTCQSGVCAGGTATVCIASDECHNAGVCDPQTGNCSNPAKPDGTACTGGTCQSGVCVP